MHTAVMHHYYCVYVCDASSQYTQYNITNVLFPVHDGVHDGKPIQLAFPSTTIFSDDKLISLQGNGLCFSMPYSTVDVE